MPNVNVGFNSIRGNIPRALGKLERFTYCWRIFSIYCPISWPSISPPFIGEIISIHHVRNIHLDAMVPLSIKWRKCYLAYRSRSFACLNPLLQCLVPFYYIRRYINFSSRAFCDDLFPRAPKWDHISSIWMSGGSSVCKHRMNTHTIEILQTSDCVPRPLVDLFDTDVKRDISVAA